MGRTKNILFFVLGFICGTGLFLSIGYYRMCRDRGTPLTASKTFGDINIILGGTQKILPDISKMLIFDKDELTLGTFFFDENGALYSFHLANSSEIIMSIYWSKERQAWENVTYGNCTPGDTYLDFDADGKFDIRTSINDVYEDEQFINIDKLWINTDEYSYRDKKASVYNQGLRQDYRYVFDEGWQLQKK